MHNAFIFGKFYPFHLGHAALIDYGLLQADELTVVVCASDKEKLFSLEQRYRWLERHYKANEKLHILPFAYREDALVNSSVSDRAVSKQWAEVFSRLLPETEAVITSEPYGDYLAEFMHIRHIPFNPDRTVVPVSASLLREKPFTYWDYLPESVKPDFVKKIVINGSESTGKTTLCRKLAEHYHSCWVAEAGREVVPHTESCRPEHLQQIIHLHAKRIKEAMVGANKLLFIDTDQHITRSYSRFLFNQDLEVEESVRLLNKADLMLYSTLDAPYVQDGTRLEIHQRNQLDASHRQELARARVSFTELSGSFQERFEQACGLIDQLLNRN